MYKKAEQPTKFIQMNESIVLRPEQEQILQYRGGRMAISAVPGSGKTWTLSLLASEIISRGILKDDQEVLVVTLVNSAVDNFHRRIQEFTSRKELLPFWGYRIRTLHGLAHDIVRERPELAGLSEDFSIIDERESRLILSDAVYAWIHTHPDVVEAYLNQDVEASRLNSIKRKELPSLLLDTSISFIRTAKDLLLTPDQLRSKIENTPISMKLVEMGIEIYSDYQRSLAYRGSIDFDDLIMNALLIIERDNQLLERLQYRWPYILEDEAQDSSRMQEVILERLAGSDGNWVRVGDPNQAIFETFTTANPKLLRDFLKRNDVMEMQLSVSGRSTKSIIDLANHLVKWTNDKHPVESVRDGLQYPPIIHPTSGNDPQPNPIDNPEKVYLGTNELTPMEELNVVADSLSQWCQNHKTETAAVLVPRNERGAELADELNRRGLEFSDTLLRVTSKTRSTAGILNSILVYLSHPDSRNRLAKVFDHWMETKTDNGSSFIKDSDIKFPKIEYLEAFLNPEPGMDWLETNQDDLDSQLTHDCLSRFRELINFWSSSVTIPIDQMLITIAQDLFTEPSDLALAYKLSLILRQANQAHPDWRIDDFSHEIELISKNRRRFTGLSQADYGFDPEQYQGKPVISTIHKAKGLEWGRVYLMSVNDYNFPSGFPGEDYIGEKWFIRDKMNLQAETLAQFEHTLSSDLYTWYKEGEATHKARLEYARERLRLLYVGITRARKELIITWNTGRGGSKGPAAALKEMMKYVGIQLENQ